MSKQKHDYFLRFASTDLGVVATVAMAFAQEDPAISAFNRGKDAFNRQDFKQAQMDFMESFSARHHPLTAYFLNYAYLKSFDFKGADMWGKTALAPSPPYSLEPRYADGAREIVRYAEARLAPPPPSSSSGGIGITTSAITSPPNPPVPDRLEPQTARRVTIEPPPLVHRALEASGTVQVENATYGGNCGAGAGNATQDISAKCNGQPSCSYAVDYTIIGDPVPGCAKNMTLAMAARERRRKRRCTWREKRRVLEKRLY
jgi:hypothetical protein